MILYFMHSRVDMDLTELLTGGVCRCVAGFGDVQVEFESLTER